MKRYDKYKNSGISWIGEVPKHWNLMKAKHMFTKQKRAVRQGDEVVTCFRDGQVTLRKNRRLTGFTESLTEVGYQGIRKGDLVIHQMDAFAGAIGVSDSDGKGTSVYHCCTPKGNYQPEYYAFLLRQMACKGFIQSLYRGIRERSSDFNFVTFGNQYLLVPPFKEQEIIVSYLNKKCSDIETYIETKQKELNALEELRMSLVSKAVTKGLNDGAPMKDSGISWIGEIPEHWKTLRNKNCLKEKKEIVGKSKDYALLSLTKGGIIYRDLENMKGKFPKDYETYKIVRANDIVFCLFDVDETPRTVGLSALEGMITGAYDVFEIKNVLKEYFYFLYLSIDDRKALRPLYTGLRKVIKIDKFLNSKIPIPPFSEQESIVSYLNKKNESIDKMKSGIESQISALKEYKQRLISDVVTGKIKVTD